MRLRYNNLIAALGGSGLTNSGTTITFTAALTYNNGVAVPTIANGDVLPLVIDPRLATFEVVYLTAYTSGATTGTITRAQDGTSASAHSVSAAVIDAPDTVDHLIGSVFQVVSLFLSVASGTGAGTTSLSITAPVANNVQGATVAKSGDKCTLWDPATGTSQTITLAADVLVGATTLTVSSFTPSENFPIGAEIIPKSWTWPIPAGPQTLAATLVGAGGGSSGAGSSSNATQQAGSAGGGQGGVTKVLIPVGTMTSLTVGIGVPGAGGAGGAAGGNPGIAGGNGGNTTVAGSGITTVIAGGGGAGQGSAATSTAQTQPGLFGQGGFAATLYTPGCGGQGQGAGAAGLNAGAPLIPGLGGGGGGGSATATLGGGAGISGGNSAQRGGISANGASGASGTAAGVSAVAARANGGGGGGGAGGGAAGTGAGGNGAAGGSGLVILQIVG